MEINTNDTIAGRKNQKNRKEGEKTSFLNELMKKEECLITEFLFDSLANDLSPGPRSAGLKKSFFSCWDRKKKCFLPIIVPYRDWN